MTAYVDNLYRQLGKRIRTQRESVNMTQEELATAIGMLRTSIVNIEAGRQRPPLHVIYQICHQLGAEPSAMMPTLADVSDVQVAIAGDVQELPPQAAQIFKQLSDA